MKIGEIGSSGSRPNNPDKIETIEGINFNATAVFQIKKNKYQWEKDKNFGGAEKKAGSID